MRNGALGLVAALAGCNQIWGNDPVQRWDASSTTSDVLADAPLPTARLELLLALTDDNGAATNVVETRAIDPAPTVQVGLVGGSLMPAPYNAGEVSIPADFPGQPWRLVYTPAGDVPHELQWAPAAGEGRAVIPQFVAPDRGAVPAGASYKLAPMGATSYTDVRAYTTGVWAAGQPTVAGTVATQAVTPTGLVTYGGPLLAPDPTKGDRVVLVDYQGTFPCQQAHGTATFAIELTGADSMQSPAPSYLTQGSAVNVTGYDVASASRVADRFGVTPTAVTSQAMFGYGASTVAPMFVTHPLGSALYGPAMMPLVRCISSEPLMGTKLTTGVSFAVPNLTTAVLPAVANVQLAVTRGLPGGATVYNGLSGATATTSGQTDYAISFPVGIPLNVELGGQSLTGADRVALASGTGTLDLTFDLDAPSAGATGVADYSTATLYRASTVPLVREREYTFTGTTLHLDRGVFAAQTEYVIELRTYAGAPGAATADFTRYTSSQSSATRWTSTFITP